jgi:prevent-host-death family protein
MPTIGIFEAKTRLSEIVRKAEAGERFTITVRGRPVAEVGPARQGPRNNMTPEEIEAAFERLMNPQIKGFTHEEIRAAIEEGRH